MADSILLTRSDLLEALRDNLPTGYGLDDVNWPNVTFTRGKDGAKWLKALIINNETNNNAAGSGHKITAGIFVVEVNYPKGSGETGAIQDAQHIKSIFENKRFSNTSTQASSILFTGVNDNWYTIQIQTNYYYEGS